MLKFLNGQNVGWLANIPVGKDFHIDVPNNTFDSSCGSGCLTTKLLNDGTFYNHKTGSPTRFSRSVLVTQNPNLTDEAVIAVTVAWKTGSFKTRDFTLQGRIYNWIPDQK